MRASVHHHVELPDAPAFVAEGGSVRGRAVQLYGPFRECNSIGNVATAVARELIAAVPGVALHGYSGGPYFDAALEPFAGVDAAAPIAIYWGVPDVVGGAIWRHPTRLGGFVCETDRIPRSWVETCNRFDVVLVPSRYCREAFRRSGVTVPVLVVPHGLEPCYRPLRPKVRTVPITFYTVADGRVPGRKGLEELLRCFRRAFQGRRDVQLRLRTQRTAAIRRYCVTYGIGPDDPLIRVEDPTGVPTEAFAAAYSDVHCVVHPAKSEGFGLIPFQAIACETPVIAPCATGMADYLDASNAMVLRIQGTCDAPDVYYGTGSHPAIDEEHLVELLRHAETAWEAEYARVRRVAPAFRARHAWANALAEIVGLVGELARIPDAAARASYLRAHVVS